MAARRGSGREAAERSAALKRANRRTALILGAIAVGVFLFTLVSHWS